jgi:hypothetical protein
MTQPGDEPARPDEGQGTEEDGDRDVRHAGGGRTPGETRVDDEIGQGD